MKSVIDIAKYNIGIIENEEDEDDEEVDEFHFLKGVTL